MKFTDDLWLHQPEITPHNEPEAYKALQEDGNLVAVATTQDVRDRSQTLQGPLLTLHLCAVLPGICWRAELPVKCLPELPAGSSRFPHQKIPS